MRSAIISTFAALAVAAPTIEKRAGPDDGAILNYALTLEHLENAFYKEGLQKFTAADFAKATGNDEFYNNLKEISLDEQTHVSFLTGALKTAGVVPVKPSTYNFGAKDAATFVAIANVLEGVGVSAYLGAAKFITNKDYLTAAGAILTVEARHSAYIRDNQNPAQSPFPAAFDIPLTFNEVYSLAAQFITASPADNPKLPVKAFPALTVTSPKGVARAGDKLNLKAAKSVSAKTAYFITFMGPVKATMTGSGDSYCVTVPKGAAAGQAYLVLTKDSAVPSDDNIVAGPAVLQIADNAAKTKKN